MKLLIVESPNKCTKIQGILDALYGTQQWRVAASVGHIRDLPKKELGVDRSRHYKPSYEVTEEKRAVVARLKQQVAAVGVEQVHLATDPDREGESIAYHLAVCLGIPLQGAKRVLFNEITEKAVKAAIASTGIINMRLVAAQEARRVIDRLAGFEVSSLMSRKLGQRLSAGRVQSVALRLCVERERHITAFALTADFRLKGLFLTLAGDYLQAYYSHVMDSQQQVNHYMSSLSSRQFAVTDVTIKPVESQPKPPFTTASLQQEAIRKFGKKGGWSAKKVMDLAQKLFEQGAITYMRTDSPNISEEAVAAIRVLVRDRYGMAYFKARTFAAKASAQEAHEAIRPTHLDLDAAGETPDEQRLYALIHARTIASQMAPAIIEQTIVRITSADPDDAYVAKASRMQFDGFLHVYTEETEEGQDEEESVIKTIAVHDRLGMLTLKARQTYAQPSRRFDEASLVAELEKRGIGRPSTYASILGGITCREYVVEQTIPARKLNSVTLTWKNGIITTSTEEQSVGGDKNKLQPTSTGCEITQFLEERFDKLVSYQFTAEMEKKLDDVVEKKANYLSVVTDFDEHHSILLTKAEQAHPDVARQSTLVPIGELNGLPLKAGKNKKTGATYVLYNGQFYDVPGCEPARVTLDMAQVAIATKEASVREREKATRRTLTEKGVTYAIRQGEFGLYVTNGTHNAPLKDITTQVQIEALTGASLSARIADHLKRKKAAGSSGSKPSGKKGGAAGFARK